eukprot:TRINITY_DN8500_c0_g1_i3.p1 TRINITY_DN8500_c0_g1~~TRINITY_DN8500_c0_g1_i3.p1  ORF type:complete len:157 (+),score=31.32 TRINITY_DN8500_c0_g1_i3:195-665(+)
MDGSGVISVARFSSTLGSQLAAIKLTADEIQLLVDRFRPAARTAWEAPLDEVDYAAFCSEVSPNTPGFVPVPDRWMHNNVTPQNTQLTETEAELLYEVLARFAELCQHRRLDLNGILRDYDSQRNGFEGGCVDSDGVQVDADHQAYRGVQCLWDSY